MTDTRCCWKETEEGYYETDCKNAFAVTDGTPSENKMFFCCYCGQPIKEVSYHAQ